MLIIYIKISNAYEEKKRKENTFFLLHVRLYNMVEKAFNDFSICTYLDY